MTEHLATETEFVPEKNAETPVSEGELTKTGDKESKNEKVPVGEVLLSDTYGAMAEALSYTRGKKWPLYLMEGSETPLTQQEVLAAWLMDVESIGNEAHEVNPDILTVNAHLGGEKRQVVDELLNTLGQIPDNAVANAWEAGVDGVIEEAVFTLRVGYAKHEDSLEFEELRRLNAAKHMYNLAFPE